MTFLKWEKDYWRGRKQLSLWHVRHVWHVKWPFWNERKFIGGEGRNSLCDIWDMCDMLNGRTRVTRATCWTCDLRLLEKSRSSFPEEKVLFIFYCAVWQVWRVWHVEQAISACWGNESCVLPPNSVSLISKRSFNMSHVSHMSQRELRPYPQ